MKPQYLDFNFRSRYFVLGKASPKIKTIWMVCHGYGQLASYFIKRFESLNDGSNLIVAPEGLSRFYLDHAESRIGASWMTREDRLIDIENYLEYLNQVHTQVINPVTQEYQAQISLLGFSQGVATICRYAAQTKARFDRLVLWAGTVPPDLNFPKAQARFQQARVQIVYGDQDQYVHRAYWEIEKKAWAKLQIKPEIKVFSGGHRLDPEVLMAL